MNLTPEVINAAADWWASEWIPDDTRTAFREALVSTLSDEELVEREGHIICSGAVLVLHVDYDPFDLLLVAVNKVTPCTGAMFSARNLLPQKTVMRIEADRIEVKSGYGAQYKIIWSTDSFVNRCT